MIEKVIRKWLNIPYLLHVHHRHWPKKRHARATVVFLHGLGNSGAAWDKVIQGAPSDVRILSVDLLGFGNSPHPKYMQYDAQIQARAVAHTLLRQLPSSKVIFVGHSMGALVAVELAKRYPYLVSGLILCSPPFYRPDAERSPARQQGLNKLYRIIHTHPEEFVRISNLAKKYKITNSSFVLDARNVKSYMGALESSIINQTSFTDALSLKQPTTIIHGRLDPVVVKKNLTYIAKHNEHIELRVINAAHEIRTKTYVTEVLNTLHKYLPSS